MNMNELAKAVVLEEGMAESLTIAQVKEVLRIAAQKIVINPTTHANFVSYGMKSLHSICKPQKLPKRIYAKGKKIKR